MTQVRQSLPPLPPSVPPSLGTYFGLVCSYIITSPTVVLDGDDKRTSYSFFPSFFDE